jgi:hypothetical protein
MNPRRQEVFPATGPGGRLTEMFDATLLQHGRINANAS